ncbi:hypothetical protein PTE30175_01215 [Pandoraea terrae]|uniref:Uncharacterized protein n=1 Tax=Pandoraea terrae TaxID=1537710 RepID=A0A5E4T8Y1_9BURK|nr:hypothetical protein [Pandoraea terrae]VVD84227.1 hypothetical protein PTE30175_01215 [Pandoraea terrae]
MTQIVTGVPAASMDFAACASVVDIICSSGCDKNTVLGIDKKGEAVLFTGWKFVLHPQQTLRARSLIATHANTKGLKRLIWLPRIGSPRVRQWMVRDLGGDAPLCMLLLDSHLARPQGGMTTAHPNMRSEPRETLSHRAPFATNTHYAAERLRGSNATQTPSAQAVHDALVAQADVPGPYDRSTTAYIGKPGPVSYTGINSFRHNARRDAPDTGTSNSHPTPADTDSLLREVIQILRGKGISLDEPDHDTIPAGPSRSAPGLTTFRDAPPTLPPGIARSTGGPVDPAGRPRKPPRLFPPPRPNLSSVSRPAHQPSPPTFG